MSAFGDSGCEHPEQVLVSRRGTEQTWRCADPGCRAVRHDDDGTPDDGDPTGLLLAIAHTVPAAARGRR